VIIEHKNILTIDNFNLDVEIRVPESDYKKIIVMCHGLTSWKEGRKNQLLKLADELCNNGFKVIQFDWRGHGKSSGIDLDVCPDSLYIDLKTIIDNLVKGEDYYLFGFSFGGFAVNQFLYKENNLDVKKIVLFGPALDPINSSLGNPKEFCYPEIHEAEISGSLEKDGYAFWKSKNWKVSKKFIDQCKSYNYKEAIKLLSNRTLILQGSNDKNVDKDYNERYAKEYNIEYKEYNASHSLFEEIDAAIVETINFYNR